MEISSINRLQFRHNPHVFASKEEAINEFNKIFFEQKGASSPEPYSLLAEPTVLLYKNEDDDTYLAGTTTKRNPHAILAIGVNSNNNTTYNENRYIFIDVHDLYTKIGNNKKAIEDAIKALTVNALTSESLALYSETTEDGTFISGEVKVADDYRIWNTSKDRYETLTNNILFANGSDPTQRGMYMYVDIDYTEGDSAFTFSVSHSDKTVTEKKVTFHNNYVTGGTYDIESQKIKLFLKEGGDPIEIDCTYLINEWKADDGTKTPVILKKNRLKFDDDTQSFQDVLSANVRIKDEMLDADGNPMRDEATGQYKKSSGSTNILSRDGSSYQSLFVDGRASNIIYYGAEGKTNVKDELDKLNKLRIANDGKNIIVGKFDGFYASVDVNYEKVVKDGTTKQELVLYTSGLDAEGKIITNKKEIEIPIAQFIDEVWYDESTEELVISYVDGKGDKRYTRINVGSLINEWDVFNEAHSVKLNKQRSVSGKDLLSADVKITTSHPNNILMDVNHELYVRGESDNIKYNTTNPKYSSVATVKDGLDTLIANLDQEIAAREADVDAEMNRATSAETALSNAITAETAAREADVDAEEARATAAETILTNKIGSGFTDDPHENVTAKFEGEVARAQNAEAALQNAITSEVNRATSAETALGSRIDNEASARTASDNTLQANIDAEANTRATNDATLDSKITTEKNRAQGIENDLRIDLTAEINNRIADVDTEEDRAKAAEDILTNKIGTGFTDQADSNVTFKFNTLSDKLNTEISDREADVDAEEARAIAEEQRIEGRLTTEITRATNAENNLDGKIGSGFTTSDTNNVTAKFNTLSGKLDTEIQNRIADVDAEETRAIAKENAISGKLDTEISDRKEYAVHSADYVKDDNAIYLRNSTGHVISTINTSDFIKDGMVDSVEIKIIEGVSYLVITFNTDSGKSDIKIPLTDIFNPSNYYTKNEIDVSQAAQNDKINTISSKTDTNTAAITDETNRATNAETLLSNAIATHTANISALGTRINDEALARTNADTALGTRIDTEVSDRQSAITALTSSLNSEISNREAADTALGTRINAEITNRTNAVSNLQNNLDTLSTELQTEANRATNAETALGQSITNLSSSLTALSGTVTANTANIATVSSKTEANTANIATVSSKTEANTANIATVSGNTNQEVSDRKQYAVHNADYDSATKRINFKNSYGNVIDYIDAANFIKDGMVENVVISNGKLIITFNTDSGKSDIEIPLTSIFNPSNYYTKNEVDVSQTAQNDKINTISGNVSTLSGTVSAVTSSILTIQSNGTQIGTFNPGTNATINVQQSVSSLTDWANNTLLIPGNLIVNGQITATSAIYSTSDINLKENIELADDVKKAQANKIEVKSFNFKSDEKKTKVYGIIAQELEARGLEEIVQTSDDGYKTVDYTSLMMLKIAYLEKENKELRSMIEDIQKKLG